MQLANSLLIELPLGNTANIMFGDQPILRGRKILTLLPTPATVDGNPAFSLSGQSLVDIMAGATVTLRTSASHDIHANLPLRYFYEAAAGGFPLELSKQEFDWSKSFITIPPGSAGSGAVVQVAVIYE